MANEYQPFSIDMNLEDVATWDGKQRPLLPVGTDYHFKVVGVENNGKMITIQSEVLEGEHAGSFVWTNYMYTNQTGLKRLKTFALACGAGLGQINSDDFMGASYYGDVIHQDGKATPDAMGNPREPKTFANVINERASLDGGATTADPAPPPITRSAPAGDAENGARRSRRT